MCELSVSNDWSSSILSAKALKFRVLLPKITNGELTSYLDRILSITEKGIRISSCTKSQIFHP